VKLDIKQIYEYQDENETFWRFSFEQIADEEGWWVWIRRPENKAFYCIGKFSEQEVLHRVEMAAKPLTQDDLIDLELWLAHGGLDKYKPKKTRKLRKKKEEITEWQPETKSD
jgi:hypothetical protein